MKYRSYKVSVTCKTIFPIHNRYKLSRIQKESLEKLWKGVLKIRKQMFNIFRNIAKYKPFAVKLQVYKIHPKSFLQTAIIHKINKTNSSFHAK